MRVNIKGIYRQVIRKNGREYVFWRHRATGKRIMSDYGTAAFVAECAKLDEEARPRSGAAPGTWGALVAAYRASTEFKDDKAARTKSDYQKIFDYLHDPQGNGKPGLTNCALGSVDPAEVLKIRDKTLARKGRRFANYVVAVMSAVWNWGIPRNLSPAINPTEAVPMLKKPKGARVVNRPWEAYELAVVLAEARENVRAAVALGAYLGLREGDVIRLEWDIYKDGVFSGQHRKTGADFWIPAPKPLRDILDPMRPKCGTGLIVKSRGGQFTESGFRANFFRLIARLVSEGKVKPGLTFHGLRHMVATRLAEAGADDKTIMAITGHQTAAMVARYTATADRKKRAKEASRLMDGGGEPQPTEE